MRRALSSILLAVFSFPLISPMLAGADSDLPACCRRDGKHHCAMTGMAEAASGIAIQAIQPKCPLFPKAGAFAPCFHTGLPGQAAQLNPPPVLLTAHRKTNQNLRRMADNRSAQKRGPPSHLD